MTEKKETKAITIKDSLNTILETTDKIDSIISECMPIMANIDRASIQESLILAKGVDLLRNEFKKSVAIKATVLAMANTNLGFMTDRSQKAILKSMGNKKSLQPYTYDEITECVIEGLLKGFRITNNEMNIISGNFYPAKNGKFRHIIEFPGLSNFQFFNHLPTYEIRTQIGYNNVIEKIQYATVECYGYYLLNNEKYTVGNVNNNEGDKIVFTIRVNKGMMEDAVIGKAFSKFFTRVLYSLTGKLLPESTDVTIPMLEEPETNETLSITNQIKNRQNPIDRNEKIKELEKLIVESGIPLEEFLLYNKIAEITELETGRIIYFIEKWNTFIEEFNKELDINIKD